jgi:hypothetical protein
VRTEILECELWNAIAEDFSRPLDEVTDYDDEEDSLLLEDEFADEEELRSNLFRQLADLRPALGALLSGLHPPVEGESGTQTNICLISSRNWSA